VTRPEDLGLVWAMGIKTTGLACETLVSKVEPEAGSGSRVAVDNVR
jgi:hypothetical protein